jgi:hypothetical protein
LSVSAQKPPKTAVPKPIGFGTHIFSRKQGIYLGFFSVFFSAVLSGHSGNAQKTQLPWHQSAGSLDSVCCGLELFCACFALVWKTVRRLWYYHFIATAFRAQEEGRRTMATSSFGQIVVLDDDMADRIIESNKTANDHPFGEPTGFFKHGTEEDARRFVERMKKRAAHEG